MNAETAKPGEGNVIAERLYGRKDLESDDVFVSRTLVDPNNAEWVRGLGTPQSS